MHTLLTLPLLAIVHWVDLMKGIFVNRSLEIYFFF